MVSLAVAMLPPGVVAVVDVAYSILWLSSSTIHSSESDHHSLTDAVYYYA